MIIVNVWYSSNLMNIFMSDVMNSISGLIIPIFPAFKLESSNEHAITIHTNVNLNIKLYVVQGNGCNSMHHFPWFLQTKKYRDPLPWWSPCQLKILYFQATYNWGNKKQIAKQQIDNRHISNVIIGLIN